MSGRINIYVPGILNFPGDADNWCGKAVTHTHLHSDTIRAEKIEYFTTAMLRPFGQGHRADKLVKTLSYYAGWDIRLIGHSNGTDVILDALKAADWPHVNALHLVCGACEADFQKNGLDAALHRGAVGQVFAYVAGKDMALRSASTWLGKLLGYGTLGLSGPLHVDPENKTRVTRRDWPTFGHSDCWAGKNFDLTMASFLEAH